MNAPVGSHSAIGTPAPDIAWLAETIRKNRFIPEPPRDLVFVGDGDFRAVGTEFLRHLVEIGGLQPDGRFLDVGSGIGRLAIPLTQYLDPERSSYDGIDPVSAGVAWCAANITPAYPRFRFQHLDVRHELYNPAGRFGGLDLVLPFDPGSHDFAVMVSVATHLPAAELERYASELARLLVPGGAVMLTAFVIEPGAPQAGRLKFTRSGDEPEWHVEGQSPLGAVAFDDGFIDVCFARQGFARRRKVPGHWSGRDGASFQDIFVFEKQRAGQ